MNRIFAQPLAVCATGICLCGGLTTPAQARYELTFFTPPGSFSAQAFGQLPSGLITGTTEGTNAITQGFLYNGSTFTLISAPGAVNGTLFGKGNANGQVAATYLNANQFGRGTIYNTTARTFTNLPNIAANANTDANSINDAGVVVGSFFTDDGLGNLGPYRGWIYNGTSYTLFDAPNVDSNELGTLAYDINNAGTVVGFYTDVNGAVRGFLRNAGGSSSAFDARLTGGSTAVVTVIYGINDAGDFAGYYRATNGGRRRGFVVRDGVQRPVDAGSGDTYVTSVAEDGTITGFYDNGSGNLQSFVGTPIAPEPGTLSLLSLMVLGAIPIRYRRSV